MTDFYSRSMQVLLRNKTLSLKIDKVMKGANVSQVNSIQPKLMKCFANHNSAIKYIMLCTYAGLFDIKFSLDAFALLYLSQL